MLPRVWSLPAGGTVVQAIQRVALAIVFCVTWLVSPAVSAATASSASPSLTVVGFGLVSAPTQTTPPQLQLNLNTRGSTASAALRALDLDVSAIKHRLEAMGIKATAVGAQSPPQLTYITATNRVSCQKIRKLKPGVTCPRPGFTASEGLQVTFPTLESLARVLSRTHVATGRGVQNFWINQGGGQPGQPTPAALARGYRAALADARRTAVALANADGLALGLATSVVQGAQPGVEGCGMGGCGGSIGLSIPPVGPNQVLVAVTVTYATAPGGG